MSISTQLTKFPCPICGKYFEPYMARKDGKAMLECPQHGLFETSIATSKNFRKFCQKLGSAPNRNPTYYTSSEQRVKRFLVNHKMKEGLDFFHNSRIGPFINGNKRKVYYWCDFVIPSKKLVLEASPAIWHKMWNRNEADERKTKFLGQLGWTVYNLNEKDLAQLNKRRTEGKILGKNPKNSPYHRTETCKKMDMIFYGVPIVS